MVCFHKAAASSRSGKSIDSALASSPSFLVTFCSLPPSIGITNVYNTEPAIDLSAQACTVSLPALATPPFRGTSSHMEYEQLKPQTAALRQSLRLQSLRLSRVRQERVTLLLHQRSGQWENEQALLKQRLDWCESLLTSERERSMRAAEEAAQARHQLSLLQVERNQAEEQPERAGGAYAQLLHRFQLLEQAPRNLTKNPITRRRRRDETQGSRTAPKRRGARTASLPGMPSGTRKPVQETEIRINEDKG